jgi:hypothetical protein
MLAHRRGRPAPADAGTRSAPFTLRPQRAPIDIAAQAAVAALFQLVTPLLTRTAVRRDPRARLAPPTIVAFAHKRDLDVPLLIAHLLGPPVWPRWLGRVTFAGSAHLFLDGFLGLYFPQLGRPLRRLLYPISLGPVLRALRIVPLGLTGAQMVAEWIDGLRTIYPDDTPLSAVLSRHGLALARAAGVSPTLTLAEVRRWRYERLLMIQTGSELLNAAALGRLQYAQARAAPARFQVAADALQAGGALVIAPEGQLSPDGALQPPRSGVYRLLRTAPEAHVLPVATTYELLADERRPRAFFSIGPPLAGLAALPRREVEAVLYRELGRLGTVTLAHLVARAVFDDPEWRAAIPTAELAARVAAEARRVAASGQPIDPALLDRAALARRFRILLRAARGRGLDARGGEVRIDRALLARPVSGWQVNPLGYAYNESRSFPVWAADREPGLSSP